MTELFIEEIFLNKNNEIDLLKYPFSLPVVKNLKSLPLNLLLSYPQAEIFVLTDEKITLTPYKETEHFLITRQFLNNPEKILKYLID